MPKGTIIATRYRVERSLGRGGMGAVYAVQHVNTGETLALKVLHPALASNAQAVERFRTEARAPVKIGTDNVVRIFDADVSQELGGVPFMVMELLDGRDLGSELKRRGAIPAGEVVLYLRQVARALDKAHALGIIHRDLKPANLYLTQRDDGTPLVKILDFGIAKLTDGLSAEMTQDGTIFGTPWYMSPEQARGHASKVGPSADLWALGLIAFRLLTGQNYWTAEGMAALIGQIVYDDMVPPSSKAPHLPPAFDQWFARACNREPDQRYKSAMELVIGLAQSLGVAVPMRSQTLDASAMGAMMGGGAGFAMNAGMSSAGGLSLSGMPGGMGASAPGGMSSSQPSAMGMSASQSQPGGMGASQSQPGGMGSSQPSHSQSQPGGMGASATAGGVSFSATPGLGTPVPGAQMAAAALLAQSPPSAQRPKKPGGASAAFGVVLAAVVLGLGVTAWLVVSKKPGGMENTAAMGTSIPSSTPAAQPPASATAAEPAQSAQPTATPAPAETAVPAPAETAAAAATTAPAAPTMSAAATSTPAPAQTAKADAPVKASAPGTGVASASKPPPPQQSSTKPAPKVGKIKF